MTGLSANIADDVSGNEDLRFTAKKMRFYGIIILTSLEVLISFSFFGYIHAEPVSFTLAFIPVMIAGCFNGVTAAVIIGTVFGLVSMFKASAHFVLPADQLFSPFLSGAPLESIVLSVGSRMLFGLLIGLLYLAVRRSAYPFAGMIAVSLTGGVIHSFIVLSVMSVCFPKSGLDITYAFETLLTPGRIISGLITAAVILLCFYALKHKLWRSFYLNFSAAYELRNAAKYRKNFYIVLTLSVLFFSVAMAVYFTDRATALFDFRDTLRSSRVRLIGTDLFLLEIQFVLGIFSLTSFFGVFLWMYYLNRLYLHNEMITDEVTGLLNRKNFFRGCEEKLQSDALSDDSPVCFMLIDADYFKSINDTYGHMEGDRVLRSIANALKAAFKDAAVLGRIGGDEFAAMVILPLGKEDIKKRLDLMYDKVRSIPCGEISVSCSTGAVMKTMPPTVDFLYKSADEVLYKAKERGRNNYVLESE